MVTTLEFSNAFTKTFLYVMKWNQLLRILLAYQRKSIVPVLGMNGTHTFSVAYSSGG